MESQSNKIENGSLIISEKTIDVRSLIYDRNPKLAKWLPGFIVRFIERLLHQKEINRILYENRHKQGIEMVSAVLDEFGANIVVHNEEYLEDENRFLLVSNHPLGGLDGLALMKTVAKTKYPIRFPVNDFLFYLPNMRELFIPINKMKNQSAEGAKTLDATFGSNDNILYFPAGLASRKIKGKIIDPIWKKTFVQKAKQFERNVIPVHVSGKNSNRFYRLANWRKRLGIKFNIEMLFLPDEMFRQKGQTIEISFGKPIPYTFFDKTKKDVDWAEYVKGIVYKIRENHN